MLTGLRTVVKVSVKNKNYKNKVFVKQNFKSAYSIRSILTWQNCLQKWVRQEIGRDSQPISFYFIFVSFTRFIFYVTLVY